MFDWLHDTMPRGIYGRALLILILPIVTIQIVVSMVFIQRHYEDVTRQMTRNVAIDIAHIREGVEQSGSAAEAAAMAARTGDSLQIDAMLPGARVAGDGFRFYDLQGRTVIATLRDRLEGLDGIDLMSWNTAELSMPTRWGTLHLSFDRRRTSASNPHQLLVIMLATGILMTVIATIFLRNQLRPIRQLASASRAFGKGRSVPFRPRGAAEVRAAGAAFLEMRARIERHIEQRTLMLSGVSHDLRTPLTRLMLGLSLMDETDEVRAMKQDVAAVVVYSTHPMLPTSHL
ncbi:MAG: HAMP domain-containing protein, partial [Rhodobacteraceae bacterium]|nr:HAMP domain-containing protein [Paracoccaceae bacterium]